MNTLRYMMNIAKYAAALTGIAEAERCYIKGYILNSNHIKVAYADNIPTPENSDTQKFARVSHSALRGKTAKQVALSIISKTKEGATYDVEKIQEQVTEAHDRIVRESGGLLRLLAA